MSPPPALATAIPLSASKNVTILSSLDKWSHTEFILAYLTGLFDWSWCPLGPSMLSEMAGLPSFLRPVPCEYCSIVFTYCPFFIWSSWRTFLNSHFPLTLFEIARWINIVIKHIRSSFSSPCCHHPRNKTHPENLCSIFSDSRLLSLCFYFIHFREHRLLFDPMD